MAKILLDYLFPITAIEPTPAASTAFLKQVLVVAKPKDGGVTAGTIVTLTAASQASTYVGTGAAAEIAELFTAGMSKVYLLPMNDLNLATAIEGHESDFFTILIARSDWADADINATQASGNITITSYANLLTTAADTVSVAGVAFTAQSGAATLGTATFRAATGNTETAASLAAQINAHPTTSALVTAVAALGVVTITSILSGTGGNSIALGYTDNGGGNIGATKSGTALTGGDGLDLGEFKGVTGVASTDDAFLAVQAVITRRCAFHIASANAAKNMFYAFGKLLSNSLAWKNQQFIPMPQADDVDTLGDAESFYDDRISFVITDSEFSSRLGFFVCGGQAIAAPYIARNIEIDMQSAALSYIADNEPAYTKVQAALLEDELKAVLDGYVEDGEIEAGVVAVTLEEDNFQADAEINIAEPKALWRIFGNMRQSL
jgi:hypothetical protein